MIFLVGDIIYRALNPGCCLLNYVTIIVSEEIFHSWASSFVISSGHSLVHAQV